MFVWQMSSFALCVIISSTLALPSRHRRSDGDLASTSTPKPCSDNTAGGCVYVRSRTVKPANGFSTIKSISENLARVEPYLASYLHHAPHNLSGSLHTGSCSTCKARRECFQVRFGASWPSAHECEWRCVNENSGCTTTEVREDGRAVTGVCKTTTTAIWSLEQYEGEENVYHVVRRTLGIGCHCAVDSDFEYY